MCRAIPARVARLDAHTAWLELDGRVVPASLGTTEIIQVGDYVLHYAGLVLERIDPEEAQAIIDALGEIAALANQEAPG